MIDKNITKEKTFNYSLFIALILINFIPTIYETIKIFFINYTTTSLSVVSQMEWFDLIDEVLRCVITIPLYYLLNKYIDNRKIFKEKVFHAGLVTFVLYGLFSIIVYFNCKELSIFMKATNISELTKYLQLETTSFVIGIVYIYFSIVFVIIGKPKYIYSLLVLKIFSLIIGDFILIPKFNSFGIAYANILTNYMLAISSIILIIKEESISFSFKTFKDKIFFKEWLRIGLPQGGEIFLNNYIYAVMICKMINKVSNQGDYWIANNFIWGWLLIPSLALSEIIKRDCKKGYKNLNHKIYKKIISIIIILWLISIPFWNILFTQGMNIQNPEEIFKIVITLLPFYIAYLISSYINSIFHGLGKTMYGLYISFGVNIVYYGIIYILFKNKIFMPNMNFIIMMFGFGMVVNLILSLIIKRICLDRN